MLTAALLSSYAAIDAAFWADVDSRVGAAATPRFRQYCANFRDAWAAEAAPDPAASALDDEVARPSLLDTGQFVARHAGAFPGLTARPFWDAREFPWLEPLVAAAPAMAAELASARGDAYDVAMAPGRAVDVFFEDGTSDTGTIDRRVESSCEDGTSDAGTIDGVDASTYDVRYADGEVERLDRSHVAPRGSAWLRKLRKRYPWPRALEATGFEHFSVARALASAEKGAFTATRAALRTCRDRAPAASRGGRFHQYGSPRFVGYSRHRPRSVLAAHSDLWNWCLTAHVPLQMPSTPRPGTRVDPPSLEAQAAVAPRHTRSGGAVAAMDRATYAEALWGEEGERVGSGAAGMIVAGEARPWTEPLVFDTSFVHSAYNDGDAPADYLHIDFYHPELTADERRALSIFQRCQGRWKKSRAALALAA
mmetsp:Transcript_25687/g.72223  ORF Transcript_25687/g.72223 Transcript_25687/m.72223 type:complete len:423 (-) Transcript_25687:31-1299(-)